MLFRTTLSPCIFQHDSILLSAIEKYENNYNGICLYVRLLYCAINRCAINKCVCVCVFVHVCVCGGGGGFELVFIKDN